MIILLIARECTDKMTVLYSRIHRPPTVAIDTAHTHTLTDIYTQIPRLFGLHASMKYVLKIPIWSFLALKWTEVAPGA